MNPEDFDPQAYELHLVVQRAEQGVNLAVQFDPKKHPRDWKGRFRDVLGGLKPGETLELPGGAKVTKMRNVYNRPGDDYVLKRSNGNQVNISGNSVSPESDIADEIENDPGVPTPEGPLSSAELEYLSGDFVVGPPKGLVDDLVEGSLSPKRARTLIRNIKDWEFGGGADKEELDAYVPGTPVAKRLITRLERLAAE